MFPISIYRNLGYAFWWLMLIMSLLFYKERAFFMDAGFQLFNLINEGHIQVYHHRFVTALPQVLPYSLMKLGAPLWALGAAFSASYILFFMAIYHILTKYLKNEYLGWTLIFLFSLISLDTFYHMQSEFYLGLSLMLLSFAIILKQPSLEEKWMVPILLALLITVGFSHKLSLLIFLFLWTFFWLQNKGIRRASYVGFLAVFLAVAAVKSIYFTNWYEAAKQAEFQNNLSAYISRLHELPSNKVFLERCLQYYYMLPLLLVVVTAHYFASKKWLRMLLVWVSCIGFALLYNISDPTAKSRFYSEVTYLPLIIFVAVPFLFDVVPFLLKKVKWLPAIFAGVLLLRLATIAFNGQVFQRNFNWIENQLAHSERLQTNRFLMKKDIAPMDTILMEWGVPFTSMHLSSLHHPDSAKTLLIMPDFEWYQDTMKQADIFLSPFHKVFRNEELNNNYYNLGNGNYQEIGE